VKSRGSHCNETLLVRAAVRPGKKLGLQSAAKNRPAVVANAPRDAFIHIYNRASEWRHTYVTLVTNWNIYHQKFGDVLQKSSGTALYATYCAPPTTVAEQRELDTLSPGGEEAECLPKNAITALCLRPRYSFHPQQSLLLCNALESKTLLILYVELRQGIKRSTAYNWETRRTLGRPLEPP